MVCRRDLYLCNICDGDQILDLLSNIDNVIVQTLITSSMCGTLPLYLRQSHGCQTRLFVLTLTRLGDMLNFGWFFVLFLISLCIL